TLVRARARAVERPRPLPPQQLTDVLLVPDLTVLGLRPDRPTALVGVDDLEAAPSEFPKRARLARPRHPPHKHLAHPAEANGRACQAPPPTLGPRCVRRFQ